MRAVLGDDRYRFCHEDDYPLTPDEHAWCPLLGETSEACPSLPQACLRPPVERRRAFALGSGGAGRSGRGPSKGNAADQPPQEDTRARPEPELKLSLPDMSGFARVLFFGLLAVFVLALARAIAKNLLRDRDGAVKADEAPPPAAPAGAPAAARGPVETDVQRLLARARAAAAQGDFGRAVDDAYAALLRRLDGDGLIEIHPSRTNGDYVRALRGRANQSELGGAVRSIARDVEAVQFGTTPPSDPVFRSVLERVLPLVTRALGLVLVGFGLSAALSCTPHQGGDEGPSETSPSGAQALVEVLGKQGFQVRHRTEKLAAVERPLTLLLLPGLSIDEATWKHLLTWVEDSGGSLFVAGAVDLPEEIGVHAAADPETAEELSPDWESAAPVQIPPGLRLLGPADVAPGVTKGYMIRRGDSVVALYKRLGKSKVVVFADERYFTNASLATAANARFLVEMLRFPTASTEVELCDEWTGLGARTPLDSVQRAELTPVVVQLFVLMALLFLWKGRAFARLRDPPAAGRRAFADHARALGLAYGRARASRHVTGLYATWAMERLRERVHRGGRTGLIPLAEAIAARTGRTEAEVMRVLVEASGARDDTAPPSSFRSTLRREDTAPARPGKDAVAADLALMGELSSFLGATGQRRPTDRTDPPAR